MSTYSYSAPVRKTAAAYVKEKMHREGPRRVWWYVNAFVGAGYPVAALIDAAVDCAVAHFRESYVGGGVEPLTRGDKLVIAWEGGTTKAEHERSVDAILKQLKPDE